MLREAIDIQVKASTEFDNPGNLISPADGKYLRMFAEGSDVAYGEIHLQTNDVVIDDSCSREYREDDSNQIAYA